MSPTLLAIVLTFFSFSLIDSKSLSFSFVNSSRSKTGLSNQSANNSNNLGKYFEREDP